MSGFGIESKTLKGGEVEMIERENTISNLETNIRWIEDIPSHQFPGWGNVTMSMRDALELLKEQEAVEARKKNDEKPQPWTRWWYVCGDCGQEIEYHDMFCRWCGRSVKWE